MVKLKVGENNRYIREINKHRKLYSNKNMKYVKNNYIFNWKFLTHLEDIGYMPGTIERYYSKIKTFLNWHINKTIRKVNKADIEKYTTYLKTVMYS